MGVSVVATNPQRYRMSKPQAKLTEQWSLQVYKPTRNSRTWRWSIWRKKTNEPPAFATEQFLSSGGVWTNNFDSKSMAIFNSEWEARNFALSHIGPQYIREVES